MRVRLRAQRRKARRAIAIARWAKQLGISLRVVAKKLGIAPSTLHGWSQRWQAGTLAMKMLGRPLVREPRIVRDAIVELLRHTNGLISIAHMKRIFPGASRVRLTRLRAVYRRSIASKRIKLTWLQPGAIWAADYTELRRHAGAPRTWVLVVRDLASGLILGTEQTRHATAQWTCTLLQRLFIEYGAPLVLKTDNGSHFTAGTVNNMLERHDVQHLLSPAYFPQYNGAIEAGMHVLKPRLYTVAYDPNNTTPDELEQARALSNEWLCERRRTSAQDRWRTGHRPIRTEDRVALRAAITEQHARHIAGLDAASQASLETDETARATVARRAIERALVERAYLNIRRSRNASMCTQ